MFRDWPLAVLVDKYTRGGAEWVAAALQDAQRATIVGIPTYADNSVPTSVPIPDSDEVLVLATGRWERPTPEPPQIGTLSDSRHVGVFFDTTVGEPGSPFRSWRVVPDIAALTSGGIHAALGLVGRIRRAVAQPDEMQPADALPIAVDELREELRSKKKTNK